MDTQPTGPWKRSVGNVASDSFRQVHSGGSRVGGRLLAGLIVVGALGVLYALAAQTRYQGGGDTPYHILSARAWAGPAGFSAADPAQTKFPPGWSLALVLCQWFVGGSYADFARFGAALFPLALLASYVLFRQRMGAGASAAWTGAMIFSASWFTVATSGVRSETLYTAVTMGFLAWSEHSFRSGRIPGFARMLGALLLVSSVLVRSIGVSLLIATAVTVAHTLWRNRQDGVRVASQFAFPFAAAVAATGAWKLLSRARTVEHYPGELMNLYGQQFWLKDPHRPGLGPASLLDVVLRIPDNLKLRATQIAELGTNVPWISPSWTSPVVVAVTVILAAGLLRELRQRFPLLAYYALFYLGILLVWPFDEGTRFLLPLFPVVVILGMSGLASLRGTLRRYRAGSATCLAVAALVELSALVAERVTHPQEFGAQAVLAVACWLILLVAGLHFRRRRTARVGAITPLIRVVALGLAAAYVALGATEIEQAARSNWRTSHDVENGFQLTSAWIVRNTEPSARIMAQRHLDFQLTTGRPGVVLPVTRDQTMLVTALQRTGTRYLVVYDETPENAYYFPLERDRLSVIQSALPEKLVLRSRIKDVAIYEVPRRALSTQAAQ